ncbi:DUF3541 domain-containing protein [Vibrio sp. ZSDE26]|uniref:DUF3541 domain-containing protein n=1 Tax=Vibrio amylolyticus TaxID=2847292 RepID=A0A9X2BM43_9VIBR|nr:DUF3541 domain-containing protein [Vibrio amylolyticus]MCK6264548.1 DUF3541 domain-containing protein [Vibrio amylolyticus]
MYKLKGLNRIVVTTAILSSMVAIRSVNADSIELKPISNEPNSPTTNSPTNSYQASAEILKHTYETQLYTLSAFKEGHYGLRMYRQTLDKKYEAAIWSDMARVASRLNSFSAEINTPEEILIYSEKRLSGYREQKDERSVRRYTTTIHHPEYLYLAVDLLGSMARANEYGLKHREDEKLRQVLRRYDFKEYVTSPEMVKAWAAQLANQVYWLRQLEEQDVVKEFTDTFKATYPDSQDKALSTQQFGNKVYGMTHIIFADSQYYQVPVRENDHQWIYDYFRQNIDTILLRAKEDIIAEVGISFLLAGLDDDPVVEKTRHAIQNAINLERGMIPSATGGFGLSYGEHRNLLAIMLLDWQSTNKAPVFGKHNSVFNDIPFGLEAKLP